jgi:hypothetical protein
MGDHRRDTHRLRQRVRELEEENQNLRETAGWHDPAYVAVMVDLLHVAINGCRRPLDLGGPIMANHAGSRPPSTQPNRAYDVLKKERADQRRRAADLRSRLARIVDGEHADEAPERRAVGAGR